MNNLFIIALFTYQYFYHHKKWYLSVFIIGAVFQTIALILIGNRNHLSFFYSVQISNLFLISSFALTSFGLLSFDGKLRKKTLWLFGIFTILFYSSFLAVGNDNALRITIQIIASSFFYGIGAFYLFINKGKYKFPIILSIVLSSYSIFQVIRASVIILHSGQSYDFMEGSAIDNCYLIISLFAISASSIGLIMLLKEIDQKTILQKNAIIQKDKLELEELNATKDKLFSIIGHDLRSPFNGIMGFLELLLENIKKFEAEKSEKYLKLTYLSAKNTFNLLDNLLNWANSQTKQVYCNPQKLILSSIIQGIIDLSISNTKIKDIKLHYSQSEIIEVNADENMLTLILRNLISNAIKFSKKGGNIKISTNVTPRLAEISISDDGVGMTKETLEKLFDISKNTTSCGTENEKGFGLGLILCKEFVEKQGGNIWVDSELGKGSDFKFTLPLYSVCL
ncbi:sensor histidine kinase [Geofilum sp. OHC36d9]|uniref:sensor histidine kinase n=1 Tax=Geofilum sp. OHC36d9 TaxID=3458413 RepID=UPI0040349D9C